jgi:putative FmdB family regulatory protein
MPIYTYRCGGCGREQDLFQTIEEGEAPARQGCPFCTRVHVPSPNASERELQGCRLDPNPLPEPEGEQVKKGKLRSFTAGFAVRMWVEVDIKAENYDAALTKAKEMKTPGSFITEDDGVEVNDSYVELVGVTDMTALNTVGGE